jgi:hypothetical protein
MDRRKYKVKYPAEPSLEEDLTAEARREYFFGWSYAG